MVTKKPKGLGRGPEALLGPKVAEAVHRPMHRKVGGQPASRRVWR
jgi:hypothetical protein